LISNFVFRIANLKRGFEFAIRNSQFAIRNLQMPNEELIYRITRAIYDRLGAVADENAVEQLVTDIYRTVEPELARNGSVSGPRTSPTSSSSSQPSRSEVSADRLIVSVFGVDHPGIVAGVSQILAEEGCSIVDINQTVVQGKFAMVIIANTTRSQASAAELKERFRAAGEKLGVRIYAQREDLFNAMHRI
jgi:ACT domain-containing protein